MVVVLRGVDHAREVKKLSCSIPQAIRDRAGLRPAAEMEFELGPDGVVRLRRKAERPHYPQPEAAMRRLKGRASRDMTADKILALTRTYSRPRIRRQDHSTQRADRRQQPVNSSRHSFVHSTTLRLLVFPHSLPSAL